MGPRMESIGFHGSSKSLKKANNNGNNFGSNRIESQEYDGYENLNHTTQQQHGANLASIERYQ